MALCHLVGQLCAAQDVEVQMLHALAGIGAAVGDDPVAVFQTFCLGDLGDHPEDVGHHSAVFFGDAVAVGNVGLGDHQHVGGSLGGNVPEGVDQVVLVDLGRGDLA